MSVSPLQFRLDPEDWAVAAACRGRGDLFFPPDVAESRGERREREAKAKAICGVCAVRIECLDEAIASGERYGIWGGLNERERRVASRRPATARDGKSPHDTVGPGRLARLPAVVVQGRRVSPRVGD